MPTLAELLGRPPPSWQTEAGGLLGSGPVLGYGGGIGEALQRPEYQWQYGNSLLGTAARGLLEYQGPLAQQARGLGRALNSLEMPMQNAPMTLANRAGFPSVMDDPRARDAANKAYVQDALTRGVGLLTAWHGSPHKFDAFKMEKIGTGEGAQAYGHGLYFAESPEVAKNYSLAGIPKNQGEATVILKSGQRLQGQALSDQMLDDVAKGRIPGAKLVYEPIKPNLYKVDLPDEQVAKFLDWDKPLSQQPESVRKAFEQLGFDASSAKFGTPEQFHNAAGNWLRGKEAVRLVNSDLYAANDVYAARKAWNAGPEAMQKYIDSADGIWLRSQLTRAKGGDKPASVAYRELSDKMGGWGATTGQGGGQTAASEALRQAGIPGIRYLDQGSRAAGKGSSNFVVFDENLPKILERK